MQVVYPKFYIGYVPMVRQIKYDICKFIKILFLIQKYFCIIGMLIRYVETNYIPLHYYQHIRAEDTLLHAFHVILYEER